MTGDLHCHTHCSDGSSSPRELVVLAKEAGLSAVAVTDHDTMAGVRQAQEYGAVYGVRVIEGVEFSCFDYTRGRKVHLLCYLPRRPELLSPVFTHVARIRRDAAFQMAQMVAKRYPITLEQILGYASRSTNLYKQHMMRALMEAGCASSIYGDVFQSLFNSKTGSCYLSPDYPDVWKVLREVKKAGGIAVLAHPSVYRSMDLLKELCESGDLDGVEIWHPRNNEEDQREAMSIAKQYGLLTTGGTDFHGMYTSRPCPVGTCTTPAGQLEALFQRARDIN